MGQTHGSWARADHSPITALPGGSRSQGPGAVTWRGLERALRKNRKASTAHPVVTIPGSPHTCSLAGGRREGLPHSATWQWCSVLELRGGLLALKERTQTLAVPPGALVSPPTALRGMAVASASARLLGAQDQWGGTYRKGRKPRAQLPLEEQGSGSQGEKPHTELRQPGGAGSQDQEHPSRPGAHKEEVRG